MIKDKIIISAITPEMIPLVWHNVRHMVEAAIEYSHGELHIDTIYNRLVDKEMVMLTVSEEDMIVAALTIEKRDFQSGKSILNVTTAGGADLHIWMDQMDPVLVDLAKEHGCEEIYIVGRAGWARALKRKGYGKIHTVVSKKVGDK